jgi:Family of unknown function (DUF6220)
VRRVYFGLSVLLLVAVVLQFYFAGVGAFSKPQTDSSYGLHSLNGMMIIPLLSILATVAAAIARAPGRVIGLAIAPLGLVVVQVLIIVIGKALGDGDNSTPAALVIYGLHAINGLAIMAVAGTNLRAARQQLRPSDSTKAGAPA